MLSQVDIKNELGKNIYIHPIHPESIKANSVDLHASQFGWSLKTKNPLKIHNQHLILPSHDTSLVYTEEAIYVSNKIGGTYHAKVMYVSEGLGHISTCLDAGYIGQSLIAIHNNSDNDISLEIGHEFVTVHFYYLHTPISINHTANDNSAGQLSLLNSYDVSNYRSWADKNTWCINKDLLYDVMTKSEKYIELKNDHEKRNFSLTRFLHHAKIPLLSFLILLTLSLILAIPAYWYNDPNINKVMIKLNECFFYPTFVAILATIVGTSVIRYIHYK